MALAWSAREEVCHEGHESAPPGSPGSAAPVKRALETHARIEEEIFYPALEERRDAADRVREAYQEHEVVKSLLREIAGIDPAGETTEAKLKVLEENVEHHVEEEEGELFPAAERLGEARLEGLARSSRNGNAGSREARSAAWCEACGG